MPDQDAKTFVGIDIGGTKSAVVLMTEDGRLVSREQFATEKGKDRWRNTADTMIRLIRRMTEKRSVEAIGVSCGGPLDSRRGRILSPPNLQGWDDVPIVELFENEFGLPAFLENDANAGALAEWKFGAGKGTRNMVFLTFGTGLGAGLILDGRLYAGTNDLGGEAGHIRLEKDGPIGYHKRGSFEGFCSGKGLAQMMTAELLCLAEEEGREPVLERYKEPSRVTGQDVVEWAKAGDGRALAVVRKSGTYLGKGLAVLIDILNPQVVVVGGMGVRLGDLLFEPARAVIREEAIPAANAVCRIVPAALGESTGDFAALCVALEGLKRGGAIKST